MQRKANVHLNKKEKKKQKASPQCDSHESNKTNRFYWCNLRSWGPQRKSGPTSDSPLAKLSSHTVFHFFHTLTHSAERESCRAVFHSTSLKKEPGKASFCYFFSTLLLIPPPSPPNPHRQIDLKDKRKEDGRGKGLFVSPSPCRSSRLSCLRIRHRCRTPQKHCNLLSL